MRRDLLLCACGEEMCRVEPHVFPLWPRAVLAAVRAFIDVVIECTAARMRIVILAATVIADVAVEAAERRRHAPVVKTEMPLGISEV